MIQQPTRTKIWIAAGVTDMRRGFDGLSGQVQTVLQVQCELYRRNHVSVSFACLEISLLAACERLKFVAECISLQRGFRDHARGIRGSGIPCVKGILGDPGSISAEIGGRHGGGDVVAVS